MMRVLQPLILALMFALPIWAQDTPAPQILYDSSESDVPLNITFDGQEILIFGAVQNLDGQNPDLIIKVTGPLQNYTIHKKHRQLGLWLNGAAMTFRNVPSFLAVLSDEPINEIILPTEQQRYDIGFRQAVPIRGITGGIKDPEQFADAFIDHQKKLKKYILNEHAVKISGDVLFSARIPLAADIIEGLYEVEIFLLGSGRVRASVTTDLPVYKSGLERWLYDLAADHGLLYGILAIFCAITAAFAMSLVMRLFQR